jgi:hypothetical protein
MLTEKHKLVTSSFGISQFLLISFPASLYTLLADSEWFNSTK